MRVQAFLKGVVMVRTQEPIAASSSAVFRNAESGFPMFCRYRGEREKREREVGRS